MSFSVSDGRGDFEYNSASPNGLFANRRHLLTPTFHRMVGDLVRFNRAARELLGEREERSRVSLGQWLDDHAFSRMFIDRLIVPQAAAVWSADPLRCGPFRHASWPSSLTTTACWASGAGRAGARSPAGRIATSTR